MPYRIMTGEGGGRVDVVVNRVCDPMTIADYEQELLTAVADARRKAGRLRLLVDSRSVGLLPPDSLARLMQLEDRLMIGPEDRVAIVVDCSLSKRQLTAPSRYDQVQRFLSRNAAEIWLSAHDHADRPATAPVR